MLARVGSTPTGTELGAAYPRSDDDISPLSLTDADSRPTSYAATFDLPVRLNTRVTGLQRSPEHGYRLSTGSATVHARNVVVATGPFQTPRIPAVATGLTDQVTQLHSSSYCNPN